MNKDNKMKGNICKNNKIKKDIRIVYIKGDIDSRLSRYIKIKKRQV